MQVSIFHPTTPTEFDRTVLGLRDHVGLTDGDELTFMTSGTVSRFNGKKVEGFAPVITHSYRKNLDGRFTGCKVPLFMGMRDRQQIVVRSRYKASKLAKEIIADAERLNYKKDGHILLIQTDDGVKPIIAAGLDVVHRVMDLMMETHKGATFMVYNKLDWDIHYRNSTQ